jgi:hypothetical protein
VFFLDLNHETLYLTIRFQNDSYCDATGTIYQTPMIELQTFAKTIHGIPAVYWKSPGEGILTPSSCCRRISFRHKSLDDGRRVCSAGKIWSLARPAADCCEVARFCYFLGPDSEQRNNLLVIPPSAPPKHSRHQPRGLHLRGPSFRRLLWKLSK